MKRRIFTSKEREIIHRKCDGRCGYCGNKITIKQMQADHYFPLSMANYFPNVEINDMVNIMPSCRTCNHYKRGRPPKEFKELIYTLHNRLSKIYINRVAENYGIITVHPFDNLWWFEKNPVHGIIYPTDIY